mmetsp:Transcript_6942/g.11094  ORF Transcript_6942/g.11094 Transcript_6942/m.11094 type:complete len:709 (+) Transcript_6942:1525-3651(+)
MAECLVPRCGRLLIGHGDPNNRLDGFVTVFPRHHQTHRRAILVRDRFVINSRGHDRQRMHRLVQAQTLHIRPVQNRKADTGHFIRAQRGFKRYVFRAVLHTGQVQQVGQLKSVPRDHHRPRLDTAKTIDALLNGHRIHNLFHGIVAGIVDQPVDLDTPRRGRQHMRVAGRVVFACAELIEVIVLRDVLIAVGHQLGRRGAAHARRPHKAKAQRPTHQLPPVQIGVIGGRVSAGQCVVPAKSHGGHLLRVKPCWDIHGTSYAPVYPPSRACQVIVTRSDLIQRQRPAIVLHNPHMATAHQARLPDTNRMGNGLHLFGDILSIAGHPFILVFHDEARLEPLVMRGDACGAGILVTLQRLNTAQTEHEAPGGGHKICACGQGPGNIARIDELARSHDTNAVLEADAVALIHNGDQCLANGHAHQIDQRHWRRAGPPLATIHCNKVRRAVRPTRCDCVKQLFDRSLGPHDGLDPYRFASDFADTGDEIQKVIPVVHLCMTVRRYAVLPNLETPDLGNLRRDLGPRQDAALTGLGPLGQLNLEHADGFMGRHFAQLILRQGAILVADPELGRSDLKNDVGPALKVKGAQATLARIHPDARLFRTPAQGLHSRFGNRAIAHAGYVKKRLCIIRCAGSGPDDHRCGLGKLGFERWKGRVHKDRRSDHGQVAGGPKGDRIAVPLTRPVNPFPLCPVKGQLLAVHGKEILAEKLPQT